MVHFTQTKVKNGLPNTTYPQFSLGLLISYPCRPLKWWGHKSFVCHLGIGMKSQKTVPSLLDMIVIANFGGFFMVWFTTR